MGSHAKYPWRSLVRVMLPFGRLLLFHLLEELLDISWHRDVEVASFVVPINLDPTVEFSLPVYGQLVILLQDLKQMFNMFLTYVLDTAVIHHKQKLNGPCDMSPEAWCVCTFIITCRGETFREQIVDESTCLR